MIKGSSAMRSGRRGRPVTSTPSESKQENTRKERPKSKGEYIIPQCPYCGSKGELSGKKWICPTCSDVSVGTYEGSSKPLGTLADKDTRQWRMRAHDELHYKWQDGETKENFYGWIASIVKKEYKMATIANLNADECRLLIKEGRKELYNKRYKHIFDHNR